MKASELPFDHDVDDWYGVRVFEHEPLDERNGPLLGCPTCEVAWRIPLLENDEMRDDWWVCPSGCNATFSVQGGTFEVVRGDPTDPAGNQLVFYPESGNERVISSDSDPDMPVAYGPEALRRWWEQRFPAEPLA